MLTGSCLCGAVKFGLNSPPTMMGTCHCTRCRKAGASTLVFVQRDSFELLGGAESIATYTPPAPYKYKRCFCTVCGTALGEVTSEADAFPVAASCFDDELQLGNAFHMFVKDKPDWVGIGDAAPQFPADPPN